VADNFGEPRVSPADGESGTPREGASPEATEEHTPPTAAAGSHDPLRPASMRGWVGSLSGIAAAPGLACAPAHTLGGDAVLFDGQPPERGTPLPDGELAPLMESFLRARKRLAATIRTEAEGARRGGRTSEAEIAEAHETLLTDPELESAVREILRSRDCPPAHAVWIAASRIAGEYRSVDDPYLRARGSDVEDVAKRLVMEIEPRSSPGGWASRWWRGFPSPRTGRGWL